MADGVSVPYGRQSWRAFLAAGHLPRLCRRLRALAARRLGLGFELAGEALRFFAEDDGANTEAADLASIDPSMLAEDGVAEILEVANRVLERAGVEPRFEFASGEASASASARGIRFGYRVTLGAGDAVPPPRELVDAARIFDADPSYPALLARHAEALAAFAGVSLTCSPSPSLADSRFGPDRFSLAVVIDEFLHLTVTIPTAPLDIQPIFDCINSRLAGSGRRLCRVLDEPWGEIAVLADDAERETLRRHGDLVEPLDDRELLSMIRGIGVELEAMSGWWSTFARYSLERTLRQVRELVRDEAALGWSIELSDDGGLTLHLPCNGVAETATYRAELERATAADVFVDVVAQLNRALVAGEVDWRAVLMTGEPIFYNRRLVLLPLEWAAQISRMPACVSGAVGPEDARPAWPVREPPAPLPPDFPRIPEIEELVPEARILDHDFKCSARPHDFYDLVVELAGFAGLSWSCDRSTPGPGPGEITLHARWGDRDFAVAVIETKYLGVGPILEAINAVLDELGDRYRLHLYRGGGYSGGVVRADPDELAALRRCGYVALAA